MKRLLTEQDLQRMGAGARVELDADTLITPAARDVAFVRGITIVERTWPGQRSASPGCACAGCTRGGPCEGPPVWPRLADGDYLLEVRDGKVRLRPLRGP